MKKLIKNVVMLDLRTATLESISGLTIDNAVTVFVTPSTKPLISQINFGNLVKLIEIPDNMTISKSNGNIVMGGNPSLNEYGANVFKMINGNLLIKNNIPEELFLKLFEHGGVINGNVTMPDYLSPAFFSSKISFNGNVQVYPSDSTLFETNIKINNGFLNGLARNSKVTVIGSVDIAEDTNPELFEDIISELVVFGNVLMHENISEMFYKAAKRYAQVTILPNTYKLYNSDITITPSNLLSFKNKKLYTKGNVIFDGDLTENQISQCDFSIKTEGIVFCPEKIAQTVFDKVITDKFQTYSSYLFTINDSYNLTAPELEMETDISYLVNGELVIAEELNVDLIVKKISEIFLYGAITCSNATQKSAINKKIKINEGDVNVPSNEPEEPEPANDNSEYDFIVSNAVEYSL